MPDGVTHKCPPDGVSAMPCCGKTPFEVPRTDRMTTTGEVTCRPPAPAPPPWCPFCPKRRTVHPPGDGSPAAQKHRRLVPIVADGLMRAAQLIRLRGWCVGALQDDSGRLCLMGAIREVFKHEIRVIRYAAYDVVNKALRRPEARMQDWNDEQTDPMKVIALLEALAIGIDPFVKTPAVCLHGQSTCPSCKVAVQCRGDDYGHCESAPGRGHHRHDCPLRPQEAVLAP